MASRPPQLDHLAAAYPSSRCRPRLLPGVYAGSDHSLCPHDPRRRSQHRGHVRCCPMRSHTPSGLRGRPLLSQVMAGGYAPHTPRSSPARTQGCCWSARAAIAACSTLSWAANATSIASASDSHRRVEPSTSVNRNVTTPEGAAAAAADTPAESHNRPAPNSHIGGIRPLTCAPQGTA